MREPTLHITPVDLNVNARVGHPLELDAREAATVTTQDGSWGSVLDIINGVDMFDDHADAAIVTVTNDTGYVRSSLYTRAQIERYAAANAKED